MKFEILGFLPAPRNFTIQISNFIGWFRLKEKLPEQKIETPVSSPHREGLWKVSEKSESFSSIEPTKNLSNFLWAGKKAKISNFISWFCLKGKLPENKI